MGARRQILMPKLGLTMTEGSVVEWPLAEGASFAAGTLWLVVENDKVANDIEAPEAGRLLKILVPQGETVPVGTVLAEWEAEAAATEPASAAVAPVAVEAAPERRWRRANALELAAARKLAESKQTIPHFYLATEIEVSRLQGLRAERNAKRGGAGKITLTHLVVAAVARALARHPAVNRVWQDEGFLELDGSDVGVAVQGDQGLLAPVLRGAGEMRLDALAAELDALVARARSMALTPADVGGGALTVSNAGMHEVTWMSSIIHPGQSAILGVGTERVLFRPDAVGAPRQVREMGVVLSCDHRVLDGVRALAFLNDIRAALEAADSLFD